MVIREIFGASALVGLPLVFVSSSAVGAEPCGEGQYRDLASERCEALEVSPSFRGFTTGVGVLVACYEPSLRSALANAESERTEAGEVAPKSLHLPSDCVFELDRPLAIPSHVRVHGHGAKLRFHLEAQASCDAHTSGNRTSSVVAVMLRRTENVILEDLSIEIADASSCQTVDALRIQGAKNVLVDGVSAYGARGSWAAGIKVWKSRDVVVRNSFAHRNTRGLLVAGGADRVSAYSNFLVDNELYGIVVSGAGSEVAGNHIVGSPRSVFVRRGKAPVRLHHNALTVLGGNAKRAIWIAKDKGQRGRRAAVVVHGNRILDARGERVAVDGQEVAQVARN
ncbi:MAG: right-handed parallel beta-helix repeat-containing protein [Deltaproteobacteria bacterium]|nr:right-handed parallel beta-helix repeat-containing protein [Deltaproteobacteria bacterium]